MRETEYYWHADFAELRRSTWNSIILTLVYIKFFLNSQTLSLGHALFEPFEQVSQIQAQLLGATFEMLSGGPAQTHIGTGGGGAHRLICRGVRKIDTEAEENEINPDCNLIGNRD